MKKLVIISNLALILLSSCATQKIGTISNNNDDVYTNPKEDKIVEARLAALKKQAQEAADKRYNDSITSIKLAQKAKDDANPYYKDREFKYDDYYDYEYATRVKRFSNNINGLSYYDNYYTNSYWYNKNPYNYGVSVYNGYSWWGPSYNAYSYNPSINFYNNWGWGCTPSYGYGGYNPYMSSYAQGYNNGFYNGMWGNYYGYGNPYSSPYGYGNSFGLGYGFVSPYGYGFPYNGYSNAYNNGWGYYNSYDNNSSYSYGPRSSHEGGNSHRTSDPSVNSSSNSSYYEKYINTVAQQQAHIVKFSEPVLNHNNSSNEPIRVNSSGVPIGTGGVKQPISNLGDGQIRGNNSPVKTIDFNEPTRNNPVRYNNENTPIIKEPVINPPVKSYEQTQPIRQEPIRQPVDNTPRYEPPVRQENNFQTPSFPSNRNGGGGGGTSPSGGGGYRPR